MRIDITELINTGSLIKQGLTYINTRDGHVRLYDAYRLSDIDGYYRWKEQCIRVLQLYFPSDLERFIKYSEEFERHHYLPKYISNMIGVLDACETLPSEKLKQEKDVVAREEEISKVEELEQNYINQTSERYIQNSIVAFHEWHASACVLFDKWFYPTDEDWIKFQSIDGDGNGYVLKDYYDMIYSSYKKLMAKLKDGRGIKGTVVPKATVFSRKKESTGNKINIFISYAHTDEKWLDRLKKHLKVLTKYTDSVEYWEDTKLRGGDKWREEITMAIERSSVAILMVSTDFLASDFISNDELPPILRKAEEEGTRILPLIVSPCSFELSDISEFQAINSPDRTLADLGDDEAAIERVFLELIKSIQSLL